MSYRNPQQVIDTQTGQHYRNLQNVISSTFAGVAQNYKAEQDKLLAEKKKREETLKQRKQYFQGLQDQIMDDTNKALHGANGPVDKTKLFNKISMFSDLSLALENGTITDPKEVSRTREMLSQIKTIPSALKSSLVGMGALTEEYKEKWDKAGKKGGVDLKNVDPKKIEYLDIFLNKQKGTREFVSETDENGVERIGIFLKSTNPEDKGKTFTQEELRSYLDGETDLLPTIPDDTTQLDRFDKLVEGEGGARKKGLPKKDFFVKVTEYRNDGSVVVKQVVDEKKLKDSLKGEAIGYIGSLKDGELISFYENILDKNEVMTNKLIEEELLLKDTKVLTSDMLSGEDGKALRDRIADMYLDDYISTRRYKEVEIKDYAYDPNKNQGGGNGDDDKSKTLYKPGDIKAEFGSGPLTQVDMGDLKNKLEKKGFVVGDPYIDSNKMGGRTVMKVTMYGVDGSRNYVIINDDMTQEDIDNNLLRVTGSKPVEDGTINAPFVFEP